MWLARLLIILCFLIAFTLSFAGWFERFTSAQLFAMGSFLSAGGFVTLYAISRVFRTYLKARSIKALTLMQTMRFYGIMALFKAHDRILPPIFAVPTALMDIFFASTSFYVAARLIDRSARARPGFVLWHLLGLCALGISALLAIFTAPTHPLLVSGGITSQPMTMFPMSIVPVFIGPMVLIFHLLALAAVYENRR